MESDNKQGSMEFPQTEEGGRIFEEYFSAYFDEQSDFEVHRRWVEWNLLKWGPEGCREVAAKLIRFSEERGRRPVAYLTWLVGKKDGKPSGISRKKWGFLSEQEYESLKDRYYRHYDDYRWWATNYRYGQPDEAQARIELERRRLRRSRGSPPR